MTETRPATSSKSFPFYAGPSARGAVVVPPTAPVHIESLSRAAIEDPSRYRPHPDLAAAVNTALLLGLPLLVTGEPGCGKTQLGEAVAYALGLRHAKFEIKSTSQARDVLYVFDVVGRFHAKDAKPGTPEADPRFFIEYTALGAAILRAHPREAVEGLLPTGPHTFAHPGLPERSVVVIDEVDKAPRDFPNDLLNEIDRMYFRVPELGAIGLRGTPGADDRSKGLPGHMRPIVIFTSNSEKKLPDAFLRRCAYFHIPDPGPSELTEIVDARLAAGGLTGRPMVRDAIAFYGELRDPQRGLAKKPGIAELLNWLQALIGQGGRLDQPLAEQVALVRSTLAVLVKTSDDLKRVAPGDDPRSQSVFGQWAAERAKANGARPGMTPARA